MKLFNRSATGAGALVMLLTLAACGSSSGGGGTADAAAPAPAPPVNSTPAPVFVEGTEIPLTATRDGAGALGFVSQLASSSDETSEPLVVGDAVLASSETDEPAPLN